MQLQKSKFIPNFAQKFQKSPLKVILNLSIVCHYVTNRAITLLEHYLIIV